MRLDVYNARQYLGGYHLGGTAQVRIGRGRRNEIILPHRTVSRHHANLIRQGSRFLLLDRSTNGTFVGRKKVDRAVLQNGDEFLVGPFRLRLSEDEPEWDRETEVDGSDETGVFFEGMVGKSPGMVGLFEMTGRVAGTSGTALIVGETGCGKELVARAVHGLSSRSKGPFVALNCGAINPNLVESELFGHEKGAFTGASTDRMGAFEQADRGTLFLDEIGELSLDLQPKLLRVLETGEIRRVGSQSSVRVDVRVVAATHRDLQQEVERDRFRQDLLYRLHVLPLEVPALRERKEDIPLLVRHFLGSGIDLNEAAMRRLVNHSWPGNVRELKNVLERALILRQGGRIEPDDLIFLQESWTPPAIDLNDETPRTLEEIERMYYVRALERSDGNMRAAAKSLGVAKSTFYDRVRRYGLSPKKSGDDDG